MRCVAMNAPLLIVGLEFRVQVIMHGIINAVCCNRNVPVQLHALFFIRQSSLIYSI